MLLAISQMIGGSQMPLPSDSKTFVVPNQCQSKNHIFHNASAVAKYMLLFLFMKDIVFIL